jgi:septal ring factor EnvC (AmiA/AmiB activator)
VTRFLAFLAILLGLAAPALAQAPSQAELDKLRSRLKQLEQQYQNTRESQADATDALRQSEKAISEARRTLRGLEFQQQSTQTTLQQTREATAALSARIDSQQQKLSRLLRTLYQRGQGDSLKLLLNGQDPNQIARNLHYLGNVSRAQMALIDSLRADLLKLSALQQIAQAKNHELERIKADQLSQQHRLLQERQSRQKVLKQISHQVQTQRKEIATLRRNEQRLTELVEKLAALMARREAERRSRQATAAAKAEGRGKTGRKAEPGAVAQGPVGVNTAVPEAGEDGTSAFARLKGLLRLPVKGELMNRFGTPREEGGLNWKGVFIRATAGAEVRAVATGRVVFADWLRGFGNLVILDHGQGYMSLYSNNESLYKQAGDAVKTGDAVASVGNSGGQAEPGVYFELRYKSRPINPMDWVK